MDRNVNERERNRSKEYYLEELVLDYPNSQHTGYAEQDIIVQIRDAQTKSGKQFRKVILKKDGVIIAKTNVHGEVKFTEEYLDYVRERDRDKQIELDKQKYYLQEQEIERQYAEQEQEKQREVSERKKMETSEKVQDEKGKKKEYLNENEKKKMEQELEDRYLIVAEISDPEIVSKFNSLEGYIGNPYVVMDKKTNEIRIAGKDQGGEMKLSDYSNTQPVPEEVTRMNQDGTQTRKTGITKMMYIGPERNEALNLEIDGSGKVAVNKVMNPRSDNPIVVPIDTKQTEPTSIEVDKMKQNEEGMDKLMEKLEEMQDKGLLTEQDAENKLEEISNNGKTLEEDLEDLEALEKQKEQEAVNELEDEDDFHSLGTPWGNPNRH